MTRISVSDNGEAERERQDFNTFAVEYAQFRKIDPPVLDDLIKTGQLTPDSTVLEVGCGTGNYLNEIAARTQASCYGLDPADKMLAQAQTQPMASRIQWQQGYARQLAFPEATFDLVYTVDVSHHIQHLLTYFQEVFRVLKPGGKVCTVTDSEWIISHREPLATFFPETIAVNLARYPTVANLLACEQEAGLMNLHEKLAEYPYMLDDVAGYRNKAYSSLHLIDDLAFQNGLRRLEASLHEGPMLCRSYYLMLWGQKPPYG